MAAVVGTVQQAFGVAPVTGPGPSVVTSTLRVMHCFVEVIWPTGTYSTGSGKATFAPATVIQNERRNGKTVTIRQAAFVGAGDENGSNVAAGACTNSGGTVTCELLKDDLSTAHDDTAMNATWNRPLTFCVSFTEAV